jgi:putative ABC transport system substrate-binding protein
MTIHIRRREFIFTLGGAAAAWPLAARAQQSAMPVIGYLGQGSLEENRPHVTAFHKGLNETGYFEARNVAMEYRWTEGRRDRLPELAAELVRRGVAVIVAAGGGATATAAKVATATVPIVFGVDDPVRYGLVAALNRPGGNATGVALFTSTLAGKRLEIMRELMTTEGTLAVLVNPNNPRAESYVKETRTAADTLGMRLHVLNASTEGDLDAAFLTLNQQRIGALLVNTDPLFFNQRRKLVALAARDSVRVAYFNREFATIGGLISYGASLMGGFRQMGIYAGRILKGANPAEMPVEQPTTFELVINLKTAKALGLEIPATLLARADEVIE